MKSFSLILLLLIAEFMFSQAPSIQWQKRLGGSYIEDNSFVTTTSDGGYLCALTTRSNDIDAIGNHGEIDCLVVKLSASGAIEWKKCLGGSGYERVYGVLQTSDLGYIIACSTNSADGDVVGSHWFMESWIVKLDPNGNVSWKKCYGGTGDDYAYCIQQTADGGYIVGGSTNSTDGNVTINHGGQDFWLVKISSIGNIEWQKTYGGTNDESILSVKQTLDGGYIMAGRTNSVDGDITVAYGSYDFWVTKVSSSGSLQWQKSLGDYGGDSAEAVIQTDDGGYIITGSTTSTQGMVTGTHEGTGFNSDSWVVKLSNSGQLLWQKALGGRYDDCLRSTLQANDGNYISIGYTRSNDGDVSGSHGSTEMWIVKISSIDGHVLWQKTLGGTSDDSGNCIQQTSDGGFILSGLSDSDNGDAPLGFGAGRYDAWVVKLTAENLANLQFSVPELRVYPNPVNSDLIIQNNSNVNFNKVIITDLLGKKVLETTRDNQIYVQNLQNGIYILSVFTDDNLELNAKFVKQ